MGAIEVSLKEDRDPPTQLSDFNTGTVSYGKERGGAKIHEDYFGGSGTQGGQGGAVQKPIVD